MIYVIHGLDVAIRLIGEQTAAAVGILHPSAHRIVTIVPVVKLAR